MSRNQDTGPQSQLPMLLSLTLAIVLEPLLYVMPLLTLPASQSVRYIGEGQGWNQRNALAAQSDSGETAAVAISCQRFPTNCCWRGAKNLMLKANLQSGHAMARYVSRRQIALQTMAWGGETGCLVTDQAAFHFSLASGICRHVNPQNQRATHSV